MIKTFTLVFLLTATFGSSAFAQTSPSSTPESTPITKPAVKRRTFDQFDLSNGVRVPTSDQTPTGSGAAQPAAIEFVNEQTYDGVRRLVEYVGQMGSEYRAEVARDFGPTEYLPHSVLNRKLNATYRITEMFRVGLLDQIPLKHPSNQALLEETQTTLREAMNTAAISGGWSRDETQLAKMREKYNAADAPGTEGRRRAVLVAMLAQLNTNFGTLMGRIAVKK